MLVLLTILVVISTVVSIAVLLKNRQTPSLNNSRENELPSFRPLFAPDEEEIRAFERAEKSRLAEQKRENERLMAAEKIEQAREFQKIWQAAPDRLKTIELLHLAAQSENGKVYAEISAEVVKAFYEKRLKNLTAKDLADLLDSHFRLLPQQERASGALFSLKEEIVELRQKPEVS